jgi:twitching motility protein PilT
MTIKDLLALTVERQASDLHLTVDTPPLLRIDGNLVRSELPPLSAENTKTLIYGMLNKDQQEEFEKKLELDISVALAGSDRFRVNVHMQRSCVEAAFRRVPIKIPAIAELGLPKVVEDLARKPHGLVLVTGPTGVGKTTTLAAMVNLLNLESDKLIICIEDPIEFIHDNIKAIIKQREVYLDTHSFAEALRHCLRQDPDVIVVGEMRDLETISTALTAAETGHLVLATLHTPDAPQTIQRIIDVFPPYQQRQVRLQLADSLQGIVSQILLPRASGGGRVVATEIMIGTHAVRNLIREEEVEQLVTLIQTGAAHGMHTMDKCLKSLYGAGTITYDTAIAWATNPSEFKSL